MWVFWGCAKGMDFLGRQILKYEILSPPPPPPPPPLPPLVIKKFEWGPWGFYISKTWQEYLACKQNQSLIICNIREEQIRFVPTMSNADQCWYNWWHTVHWREWCGTKQSDSTLALMTVATNVDHSKYCNSDVNTGGTATATLHTI